MRREQGRRFPIPAKIMASVCVFAFFWGTTWIAGVTGFLPEWTPAVMSVIMVLGIGCALFPTTRRHGGCGLGCGLGLLALIAFAMAASRFPGQDKARELPRESAPVPSWLNGVQPSVDGVTLGMPKGRVPAGVQVEYTGGVVSAVEGRELRQRDRVLVSAGDGLDRAQRVLQPGIAPRSVFRREGYVIAVRGQGSRVATLRLGKAATEGP